MKHQYIYIFTYMRDKQNKNQSYLYISVFT